MLSRLPRWRARLRIGDTSHHDHRPARVPAVLCLLDRAASGSSASCALLSGCSSWCAIRLRCRRSAAVITDEYRALLGALLVIMVLLLFASTAMYFIERGAQPSKFGSKSGRLLVGARYPSPTVGYGDVVPITPLGKMLGGVVMLLGVGMIALPIAIIATGFSQKSGRHQFVVAWKGVRRAPCRCSPP